MKFYRVCNEYTKQGLWYKADGSFAGLIHNIYDFCKHKNLEMNFDPELKGFLSATDSLEGLFEWFPPEDILELQKIGFYIHTYESEDFKFYERFQHWIINATTSKIIEKIPLEHESTKETSNY